uniref:Acetylglutamate kinase n=1 Tax=Helminthocladia australis TaxID=260093 RepID=A0A1G4NU05_9FLOR|nr:Acetylglutamate kinase [Helminthocladia australis]SCW22036.1 Acetylglutamate kinase [Helminthocladia australis]
MNDSDKTAIIKQAICSIEASDSPQLVVIKYGGAAMKDDHLTHKMIENIAVLHSLGIKCIIVHGGGPFINKWLEKLDIIPRFENGIRITDAVTMDVVQMVLSGQINKNIVARLNMKGVKAVGLSGQDGNLIVASPIQELSDNRVANVSSINVELINLLLNNNYIPVIAPIGLNRSGISYNINADLVAAAISERLTAESLLMLTDTPGILMDYNDPLSVIKSLKVTDITQFIEKGIISGGMLPKVNACIQAVNKGVEKAKILDGRIADSILLSFISDYQTGTTIYQ